jgi:hypothetical protein
MGQDLSVTKVPALLLTARYLGSAASPQWDQSMHFTFFNEDKS